MKDQNDQQTADLLDTTRPRGRPRTGAARTAAERQRAYRKRARGDDRASLSVVISAEARISLAALAQHQSCSQAEVLERLLLAEKRRIVGEICATVSPEEQDAALQRFFGVK